MQRNRSLLILTALIFTTTSAAFANEHATKPAPKLTNMDLKKAVTPEVPKVINAPVPKQVAPDLIQPKPSKFTGPSANVDTKLESALDREIEELNGLVKKYEKDAQLGRLLMRLAEAYGEKANLVAFRLLEENKPVESAYGYNMKAVDTYKRFLRDFPQNAQAPNAMYLMGYNYFAAKKTKEGEEAYTKVISAYPQSAPALHAQLQLAEHLFERRQWDKAMALYTKVLEDKSNQTNFLIAKYKRAWCRFHKANLDLALEEMKSVFELIKNDKSGISVGLLEETTKSLIYLFGQSGRYSEAAKFLAGIESGDKLVGHLAELGAVYRERGDVVGVAHLYGHALKLAPLYPKAPYFEFELIPKNFSVTDPDAYQAQLSALLKKYERSGAWAKRNAPTEPEVRKFLEEKAFSWAMVNHRGLQFKTPGVTNERTIAAYEMYFTHFADSARAGAAHYFYGDLLFDNKHFEKAAGHYEEVLAKKDGAYYDEALLNAVLARDKTLPTEDELKKIIEGPAQKLEFPKSVTSFQAAAEKYLEKHPRDGAALTLRYRLALLDYTYKHNDEAEQAFAALIKDFPKTEYAKNSANLILDIYDRRGNYEGFVQAGKSFLGDANINEGETGAGIKGMTERAAFKVAQAAGDAKKTEQSTVLFLAFTKEYPESSLNGLAYFNAAVNLDKAGKLNAATENYEKSLAKESPEKSKYELKARTALVDLYNKLGQFSLAAAEYEKVARLTAGPVEKAAFLFKAGVLWFNLGKYDAAQSDFSKATEFDQKLLLESLELMADVSEAKKDYRGGSKQVTRLISGLGQDPKRCGWMLRRARFERDAGNQKAFYSGLNETNDCFNKLDDKAKTTWAAVGANAKYLLARQSLQALKQQKQKKLELKLSALNKLDADFKEIIELNVSEYIVKSLAAQGEAYYFLARFIEETPAPKGLPEESLKEYRAQLGEIVTKMDGQSKSFLDLAVKKSNEFKVLALMSPVGRGPGSEDGQKVQLDLGKKDVFN